MSRIIINDLYGGKIFNDFFGIVLPFDSDLYPGSELQLLYNSSILGKIKVISTRIFPVHQLREFICALEVGEADVKLFARKISQKHGPLNPNDNLVHCSVKYMSKDFENLDPLIQEWWNQQKSNQ